MSLGEVTRAMIKHELRDRGWCKGVWETSKARPMSGEGSYFDRLLSALGLWGDQRAYMTCHR